MSDNNYEVWFAFKKDASEDTFAQATTKITTDKPIDSLEGLTEVSRAIGVQNGYAQVYIVSTFPPIENLEEIIGSMKGTFGQLPEGKLIEGEIVE